MASSASNKLLPRGGAISEAADETEAELDVDVAATATTADVVPPQQGQASQQQGPTS